MKKSRTPEEAILAEIIELAEAIDECPMIIVINDEDGSSNCPHPTCRCADRGDVIRVRIEDDD